MSLRWAQSSLISARAVVKKNPASFYDTGTVTQIEDMRRLSREGLSPVSRRHDLLHHPRAVLPRVCHKCQTSQRRNLSWHSPCSLLLPRVLCRHAGDELSPLPVLNSALFISLDFSPFSSFLEAPRKKIQASCGIKRTKSVCLKWIFDRKSLRCV